MLQFNLQILSKIGHSALAQIPAFKRDFSPAKAAFQAASKSSATIGNASISAFLTRLMKGKRNSEEAEKKETPDSPAFTHFNTMRLNKELPSALYHLFDRSGLRAWSDDYKLLTAQAAELAIEMKNADTLVTKTENAGITFFFGDGWVWVECGQLGMHLLQKGNN